MYLFWNDQHGMLLCVTLNTNKQIGQTQIGQAGNKKSPGESGGTFFDNSITLQPTGSS